MALHKFRQSRSYRLELELESQLPQSINKVPSKHNTNGVSFSSKTSSPFESESRYNNNNNNNNNNYCLNRLLFPHNSHILSSSSSPLWLWRIRTANFLWIASTVFIVYFGDSRTNLVALLVSDPRVRRVPFYLGLLCLICNFGIFLYLSLCIHTIKKVEKLQLVASDIFPIIVMIALLTFILFTHALWPIWGFLVLPMQITFFMAFGVIIAPYTNPHINL